MIDNSYHTGREILSQPQAWMDALEVLRPQITMLQQFYKAGEFEHLLFTGCGSTYYLALSAAAVAQEQLCLPARGLPASEIWLNPDSAFVSNRKTLLIAISRSGETSETLNACQTFRAQNPQGHTVLTISCYPNSALATLGQLNLVFPSGQEQSVAQTRAFTTLYLAALALIRVWGGQSDSLKEFDNLPTACQMLLSTSLPSVTRLGREPSADRFYFLGSGLRYGLACELSLKIKEMTLSHSEPFHFMEFRHGPKSMIAPTTLIVGLVSMTNAEVELNVLREMKSLGARVLSIGEGNVDIAFGPRLSETVQAALYLPIGQWLAFERALAKGLNPDRPTHLESVVKLN